MNSLLRRMLARPVCGGAAFWAAAALCLSRPQPLDADLVKLQNGGELRGVIEVSDAQTGRISVTTLSGVRVTVARKQTRFVTRRPRIVEVYETRAKQTPNTVEAQWQLADWCRQQGPILKDERENHLRQIIRLDPEHLPARRALGHVKRDGQWMTYDEARQAEGYVKYKGKYITPQELELIQKTEAELKAEQQWYRRIRLWKAWLTGSNDRRRQEGLAHLRGVTDPYAVPALTQNLADEKNESLRRLYVRILSQIPGPRPVKPLVSLSLTDADYELRYKALNAIRPDQYDVAMTLYAAELRDDSNTIVRRAARALERVGDERVVPDLIKALVTTHRYKVRVPANNSMSFSTAGSFANSGTPLPLDIEILLRTGQLPNGVIIHDPTANQMMRTKVVTITRDQKNREVLAALTKLTGENFGYNKRDWRLWWTAKKAGTVNLSAAK